MQHSRPQSFVLSANQIFGFDSEDAQSDGKSVNLGLPVLDLPTQRSAVSENENARASSIVVGCALDNYQPEFNPN